jgi:hypothetical protein
MKIPSIRREHAEMRMATIVDDSLVAYTCATFFAEWQAFLASRLPITVKPVDEIDGLEVSRDPQHMRRNIPQAEQHFACNLLQKILVQAARWQTRSFGGGMICAPRCNHFCPSMGYCMCPGLGRANASAESIFWSIRTSGLHQLVHAGLTVRAHAQNLKKMTKLENDAGLGAFPDPAQIT